MRGRHGVVRPGFACLFVGADLVLGGQLTSQLVPPDEHPWIEEFGCTARYREFRNRVRSRLAGAANPGGGWVSRLCHDPRVAVHVLDDMLNPHLSSGRLIVSRETMLVSFSEPEGLFEVRGRELKVEAQFWLDATEMGDLIAAANLDWVIGAESREETAEPHALEGQAEPEAIQAITWCAALEHRPGEDHRIDRPDDYERWAAYEPPHWTGRLFSLTFPNVRTGEPQTLPAMGDFSWFSYRQIIPPPHPVTCLNWPQNDQMVRPYTGSNSPSDQAALDESRRITQSLLYWLQSECDLPGLRFSPEVAGTRDGLAMAPYIRESRRLRAMRTLSELEVGAQCNPGLSKMREIPDSCGIGAYRIDLHPRANGRPTVDIDALPFQIPLGCLVPRTSSRVIAAGKCLGATHVANGCTRLHPVEWNVGEAAGILAAWCLSNQIEPQDATSDPALVGKIQDELRRDGIELEWPDGVHPL